MRYALFLLALLLPTLAFAQQEPVLAVPDPEPVLAIANPGGPYVSGLIGYDFVQEVIAGAVEVGVGFGNSPFGVMGALELSPKTKGKPCPPPGDRGRDIPKPPDSLSNAYGPFAAASAQLTFTASASERISIKINAGAGFGISFGGETPAPDQFAADGPNFGPVIVAGVSAEWTLDDRTSVGLVYRGTAFYPGEVTVEDTIGTTGFGTADPIYRQLLGVVASVYF